MNLSDYLRLEHVLIDVGCRTKIDFLSKICNATAAITNVSADVVRVALTHDTRAEQNCVANGVALLHAELDDLELPLCLVVRLDHAVDIDARDGNPVDLVFVLFTPAAGKTNWLNILSCVARPLQDDALLLTLRSALSAEEIFLALTSSAQLSIKAGRDVSCREAMSRQTTASSRGFAT